MAIKQLNRSQERARGLATAGIAIGGIITLLFILPSTIAFLRN